jgi:hypothetical protein
MATNSLNLTNYDAMIKVHYAPGPVLNMAMAKNKAMGLINKRNRKVSAGGKYWFQPIQISLPGGDSIDFPTAMAAQNNNSGYGGFTVTRKHHYRLAKVDHETIEATADGDMDAFEPAFDEFDRNIEAEGNYLNFRLFRTSNASIGRMTNTSFATPILTLDDPAGVWAVVKGDVLQLSSTPGTGTVETGSLVVASVQRSAGTITFTSNISTAIPTAANLDYVYKAGDYGTGAASGLLDWVPTTAPTNTLFYGQDRSIEPELLGGLRVDGTQGNPIHEVLIDMVVQIDNIGGDPDVIFANPLALGSLSKQLEGKWVIMKGAEYGGKEAEIGYKGWQVNLEGHEVTIFSDRTCPQKNLFMLQMDTWTMFSAGMAPGFLQKRAASIIKVSENADGYEARVGEYYNFSCKGPGYNCVAQLS